MLSLKGGQFVRFYHRSGEFVVAFHGCGAPGEGSI